MTRELVPASLNRSGSEGPTGSARAARSIVNERRAATHTPAGMPGSILLFQGSLIDWKTSPQCVKLCSQEDVKE